MTVEMPDEPPAPPEQIGETMQNQLLKSDETMTELKGAEVETDTTVGTTREPALTRTIELAGQSAPPQKIVVITHVAGARTGVVERIAFQDTATITFGRNPDNTVVFDPVSDDIASRVHATLRIAGEMFSRCMLTDAHSRNGTFVNGTSIISTTPVKPGDRIVFGEGGPAVIFDID